MRTSLLDLPPELLLIVGRSLCTAEHFRYALHCRQVSKLLCEALELVRQEVEARCVRFSRELTMTCELSDDLRSITPQEQDDLVVGHSVCSPLPTSGRSTWRVTLTESVDDQASCLVVGVCDEECRISWGVHLYHGGLLRGSVKTIYSSEARLPATFAGVRFARRNISDLRGAAIGGSVDITVDHDRGTLGFRVNRAGEGPGPYTLAIVGPSASGGFPPHAKLRPWVAAWRRGDRVSIQGWL